MVDVNPRTVQRWVASGELPCIKLNHNANSPIRFRIEDVTDFLSRMRQAKEAQYGKGKPSADPTTAPTVSKVGQRGFGRAGQVLTIADNSVKE